MIPSEKRDHRIDRRHADDLIALHRRALSTEDARLRGGVFGGVFHAAAVRELLDQEGAALVRYAYAQRPNGEPTLILWAERADGTRIEAITLDYHFPCPPFCPEG